MKIISHVKSIVNHIERSFNQESFNPPKIPGVSNDPQGFFAHLSSMSQLSKPVYPIYCFTACCGTAGSEVSGGRRPIEIAGRMARSICA
jgi:hypothetical protein